jgi:hypothetical protein
VWKLRNFLFFIAVAGNGFAVDLKGVRPKTLVVAHGGFNSCKNHKNQAGKMEIDISKSFHYRVVAGECKPLAAKGKPCHANAEWLKESMRENLSESFYSRGLFLVRLSTCINFIGSGLMPRLFSGQARARRCGRIWFSSRYHEDLPMSLVTPTAAGPLCIRR